MKSWLLLCIFYFCWVANNKAQTYTTPDSTIQIMESDVLGNVYLVSKNNQLYKLDSLGKIIATLNYPYSGRIKSIDVSNPMDIYLFYEELNRIVFLDDNLGFRGELNLSNTSINQAQAIARSYDNACWVYDISDFSLKKISKSGELLLQSANLGVVTNADAILLRKILDDGKAISLITLDSLTFQFNVFANLTHTFHKKAIFADSEKIIFAKDSSIIIKNVSTKIESILFSQFPLTVDLYTNDKHLYFIRNKYCQKIF